MLAVQRKEIEVAMEESQNKVLLVFVMRLGWLLSKISDAEFGKAYPPLSKAMV